jgi:ketosteroid isomerase-like protein
VLENIFMKIGSDWEGFTVDVDRFLDAGETVIMEGRYGGMYKATGRKTHAQVVHIWVARDGKLVEFRQYCDTAELRDVSGRSTPASASA